MIAVDNGQERRLDPVPFGALNAAFEGGFCTRAG